MKFCHGKDGQIFLDNDTNRVMLQTEGGFDFPPAELRRLAHRHYLRKVWCEHLGIRYFHLVVPNKETVLADFLPDSVVYERFGSTPVRRYLDQLGEEAYDIFFRPDVFNGGDVRLASYYRTDSHWTSAGALRYFRSFLSTYGLVDAFKSLESIPMREVPKEFLGDLGRHASAMPEQVREVEVVAPESQILFEGNIVNEGYLRCSRSLSRRSVKQKIFVVHDSFAQWLFPFVSEVFSEAVFVHTPDLDFGFLSAYAPDIVLFLQAERFLPRIVSNEMLISFWLSEIAKKKGVADISSAFVRSLERVTN